MSDLASDRVLLPAADCDVLLGVVAIATWLGISLGACRTLIAAGLIETWPLPGRRTRFALKSRLTATFHRYASTVRNGS